MNKNKTVKKNHQFKWIIRKGKKSGAEALRVYIQNNRENLNKIGIALRHDLKSSVERNRVKRIIREAYRLEENKLLTGYNIIICPNYKEITIDDTHKSLVKCFNQLKMYKEDND